MTQALHTPLPGAAAATAQTAAAGTTGKAPVLQAVDLSTGHRSTCVGSHIDLDLYSGEILCLLGPNGGGKTTLFRTLLGLLAPLAGRVLVQQQPVASWSRAAFARHVGYVPQAHAGVFAYTVQDMVVMGRSAHLGALASPSRADHSHALHCLESMGIAHLRQRIYTELSGGERQLVLIARALAQEPAVLVMDEPTASLDFGNQIRVLDHIMRLREQGMAVLLSTHQPEHALQVADRIALLGQGRLLGIGPSRSMATPAQLAALYGVSEASVASRLNLVAGTGSAPLA